jgi:hypothetical protein
MVSWWAGEQNANDVVGPNNGAMQNGATYAAGKVGQAFFFDGVDDRILVPHHANQNLGAGITVDAWVYPVSSGHGRSIIQKRSTLDIGGFVLETTHSPDGPANGLRSVVWVGGQPVEAVTAANVVPLNTWTHVAVTYDGCWMTVYVDGIGIQAVHIMGAIDPSNEPVIIGRNSTWHGRIDELHMFNRALTALEVYEIYTACGRCTGARDRAVAELPESVQPEHRDRLRVTRSGRRESQRVRCKRSPRPFAGSCANERRPALGALGWKRRGRRRGRERCVLLSAAIR